MIVLFSRKIISLCIYGFIVVIDFIVSIVFIELIESIVPIVILGGSQWSMFNGQCPMVNVQWSMVKGIMRFSFASTVLGKMVRACSRKMLSSS